MLNYWGDFLGESICMDIMFYQRCFSCRLIIENKNYASFLLFKAAEKSCMIFIFDKEKSL